MRKSRRLGSTVWVWTFCVLLCSCVLNSSCPLTDCNNCSVPLLEGRWMAEKKDPNGALIREYVEVSDAGKVYLWKKRGATDSFFILTKLGDSYFLSVPAPENQYHILKLRFDENEIRLLGLDQPGEESVKREIYRKLPDGRWVTKVSQKALQEWCARNAEHFSNQISLYQRQK